LGARTTLSTLVASSPNIHVDKIPMAGNGKPTRTEAERIGNA